MNFQTKALPPLGWFIGSMLLGLSLSSFSLISDSLRFLPHWLLIITLFWIVLFPWVFGLIFAACMGLLLDSLQGDLLGVHGLFFSLTAWIAWLRADSLNKDQLGRHLLQILGLLAFYEFNLGWFYWWLHAEPLSRDSLWSIASSLLVWLLLWTLLKSKVMKPAR
jgi:rod shape-determining protein MreD